MLSSTLRVSLIFRRERALKPPQRPSRRSPGVCRDGLAATYVEKDADFLYPPHSSMASYIATTFCGGASGRMLWIVLKTKPPPGMNTSSRRLT